MDVGEVRAEYIHNCGCTFFANLTLSLIGIELGLDCDFFSAGADAS